jgi:hypothetical protein
MSNSTVIVFTIQSSLNAFREFWEKHVLELPDVPNDRKVCPTCRTQYRPRHPTKEAAFVTEDLESREQWLTGTCSSNCWNHLDTA